MLDAGLKSESKEDRRLPAFAGRRDSRRAGLDARRRRTSIRAAANQFGDLVGAAAGGLAVALAGFQGLGIALGAMFLAAAVIHAPRLLPITARVAPQAVG
jgi:hypothetical protein